MYYLCQSRIKEIKKYAKKDPNSKNVKILAKQLVQLRSQRDRLISTNANMSTIKNQATMMGTQATMTKALGQAGQAMKTANKNVNMEQIRSTMQNFAQESMKMEMSQEMMEDTLSDVFDNSEDEEETDEIVNQVLDEIGIDLGAMMGAAPSTNLGNQNAVVEGSSEDAALDAEADALLARLTAM